MACLENMPPENGDSEMEEGEIVDDLDELSDISSEEEFLLRQRLQVLENYNNALERKKAKNSSVRPGKHREDTFLHDLSEISATDLDDNAANVNCKTKVIIYREPSEQKSLKVHHKQKKRKELETHSSLARTRDHKKRVHRKKKLEVKIISESSEESDDEYRNKRRKLANAVTLNKNIKIDKSSLHDRLRKMLCGTKPNTEKVTEDKQTETESRPTVENVSCSPIILKNSEPILVDEIHNTESHEPDTKVTWELIDICTDEEDNDQAVDTVDSGAKESVHTVDSVAKEEKGEEPKKDTERDSDEDLELLRQHALKTKSSKVKPDPPLPPEPEKPTSDDEDAELRLICLKSALLKRAIEMKQKQRIRKRLSQSSNLKDDFLNDRDELLANIESPNNTDTESVDMDIGSDADDKTKDLIHEQMKSVTGVSVRNEKDVQKTTEKQNLLKAEEMEEDEDLLRAQLLTSLSKNLPKLVDPIIISTVEKEKEIREKDPPAPKTQLPENRIIINLGESDSEGEEHEATKNLTKMHMKLSEQIDFQQKLDMFLKSTRMEVERSKLPDVVNKSGPKTPEKFVAKTVNHLPKSEQIEYKNLVKRMAELEKIKQVRQMAMNIMNKPPEKDTLKPRNVSVDQMKTITVEKLEEQITLSRKKIAEESAKMLKLKEEATKLSQKYKIVATELKNVSTAITLNKKEQRSVQNRLSKIRIQHQRLLNSSSNKHSKANGDFTVRRPNNKVFTSTKVQKENNPSKEEYKNPQMLKSVKVSVVNDISTEEKVVPSPRLSVQVDVSSNKKTVKLPVERVVDIKNVANTDSGVLENDASLPVVEKGGGNKNTELIVEKRSDFDDYESPLQALRSANWEADPNAILCPFEVGGNCKDPDCKYLHPKIPSQ